MRDGSEIEALLDALDSLARDADGKSATWRDVWTEIKNIGHAFINPAIKYPEMLHIGQPNA